MTQKRDEFRVQFPLFYRAYLCTNGEKWRIENISASGVKAVFSGSCSAPPPPGTAITAKILMPPVGECAVEGRIIRVEKQAGTVIVQFAKGKGISPQDMMTVHRHLIQLNGSQPA